MENDIKITNPSIKKNQFEFYKKNNIQWVKFHFHGKDYDIPAKEADVIFLTAGCFLVFFLFLSLLAMALEPNQ